MWEEGCWLLWLRPTTTWLEALVVVMAVAVVVVVVVVVGGILAAVVMVLAVIGIAAGVVVRAMVVVMGGGEPVHTKHTFPSSSSEIYPGCLLIIKKASCETEESPV